MTENLQEYTSSRGTSLRVDHAAGILAGVKLLGLKSRNGRTYRANALRQAAPLYEEAKVNVNHPKAGPLAPRDYQDRLGTIRNVEFRACEGLFGDLHFNPRHALAEQLAWDAEHNPRNVGFSHNVQARIKRDEAGIVVEEITHVQSVDLVADPATTQGLFEQEASEPTAWDALTVGTLQLHRPDLLEELQNAAAVEAQSQADEMQARIAVLERRQQIAELLEKHGLPAAPVAESRGVVNAAFLETLMTLPNEQEVEQRIVERAELVRQAARSNASASFATPQSREQFVGGPVNDRPQDAAEFSRLLKR